MLLQKFRISFGDEFPDDAAFDAYLIELAGAPKAGLRGRIILRGLKSLAIQYDVSEKTAPFSLWIIENFC